MRFAFSVFAAALVVAAGSGCSGDKAASPGPGTTGTKGTTVEPATTTAATRPEAPDDQSRWSAQVDSACAPSQERIDAIAPPAGAEDLDRWLSETLPLVRNQLAAVEAVELPAKQSEAKRAALFLRGLRKVERALGRFRTAINANDAKAIHQALAEANAAGTETRGYALSLGVTRCGGYSAG